MNGSLRLGTPSACAQASTSSTSVVAILFEEGSDKGLGIAQK
jgi:hypothetical protein